MIDYAFQITLGEIKKSYFDFLKIYKSTKQDDETIIQALMLGKEIENLTHIKNFKFNIESILSCFVILSKKFPETQIHLPLKQIDPITQFELWAATYIRDLKSQFDIAIKFHEMYFQAA